MQPTDHYLTITNRDGKQICGHVVYVQPQEERQRQRSAVVHLVTNDCLGPYVYSALYATASRALVGTYIVHGYVAAGDQWLFKGTFHRVEDSKPLDWE